MSICGRPDPIINERITDIDRLESTALHLVESVTGEEFDGGHTPHIRLYEKAQELLKEHNHNLVMEHLSCVKMLAKGDSAGKHLAAKDTFENAVGELKDAHEEKQLKKAG